MLSPIPQIFIFCDSQDPTLCSYLPVPSFSTASTRASTSVTEKGLLVLRCEISVCLHFELKGTTASASIFVGGTGIKALESGNTPSINESIVVFGEGINSWLLPISLSNFITRGGSSAALEMPESKIGLAVDLKNKIHD